MHQEPSLPDREPTYNNNHNNQNNNNNKNTNDNNNNNKNTNNDNNNNNNNNNNNHLKKINKFISDENTSLLTLECERYAYLKQFSQPQPYKICLDGNIH